MTIAAFVTAAAQLIFFWNFFRSLKKGAPASANPWNATTLEWITSSPPPLDNFGGEFPSVYRGPYEYSVPGEAADFLPQNLAPGRCRSQRRGGDWRDSAASLPHWNDHAPRWGAHVLHGAGQRGDRSQRFLK